MKTVESQLKEARDILCSVNISLDDIREMGIAAHDWQIADKAERIIGSVAKANRILSDIINSSNDRIEKEIQRIREVCRIFLDDTEGFDATP